MMLKCVIKTNSDTTSVTYWQIAKFISIVKCYFDLKKWRKMTKSDVKKRYKCEFWHKKHCKKKQKVTLKCVLIDEKCDAFEVSIIVTLNILTLFWSVADIYCVALKRLKMLKKKHHKMSCFLVVEERKKEKKETECLYVKCNKLKNEKCNRLREGV